MPGGGPPPPPPLPGMSGGIPRPPPLLGNLGNQLPAGLKPKKQWQVDGIKRANWKSVSYNKWQYIYLIVTDLRENKCFIYFLMFFS